MNSAGMQLLKEFEGLAPELEPGVYRAYWDKIGRVWTGPYGLTRGVTEHSTWTHRQAEDDMLSELRGYEDAVRRACTATPNENQLAAMTCLAWNIGVEGFRSSTVLRCHNKGDTAGATRAFAMWNKSKGKEIPGLTRRRAAEAALYCRVSGNEPMPQRVDPESGARHSPIIWGTSISSGAGALSLMSETSRTVGDLRYNLGEWFPYILLALVVAGAGWAIWSRIKQRRGGWA
jgi:lysozyme